MQEKCCVSVVGVGGVGAVVNTDNQNCNIYQSIFELTNERCKIGQAKKRKHVFAISVTSNVFFATRMILQT